MKDKIWYEKYQPKDLIEYIFANKEDEELFTKFVDNQEIPNLLLSGSAGVGKSSMINILMNELDINKFDIKIMSGTVANVDTVRNQIDNFCKVLARGKYRVVVIEEADEMSKPAQKAFRMVMDNNVDNARFIFTSNYPEKIIPALHSRVQEVHITQLDYQVILERTAEILEAEEIVVEDLEDLYTHVDAYTPDMRKIINSIQQFSMSGTLLPLDESVNGSEGFDEWEQLWSGGIPEKDDLVHLITTLNLDNPEPYFRVMYDAMLGNENGIEEDAIRIIAKHLYRSIVVADQEINLMSCVFAVYDCD